MCLPWLGPYTQSRLFNPFVFVKYSNMCRQTRMQRLEFHALVAKSAARVGRVVEMGTDRDQTSLAGVVDGQAVDDRVIESTAAELGVIQADQRRPVAGCVQRLLVGLQQRFELAQDRLAREFLAGFAGSAARPRVRGNEHTAST